MSAQAYFPPVPNAPPAWDPNWASRISEGLNLVIRKANNMAEITLTAGAGTTVMTDARLSAFSVLSFMPTTANAAAVQGSMWVDTQGNGHATIHHANSGTTDKNFRVLIGG
jgi:hypothetical protein